MEHRLEEPERTQVWLEDEITEWDAGGSDGSVKYKIAEVDRG